MEETHLQTTRNDREYCTVINILTTKLLEESVINELEELAVQILTQAESQKRMPNIVLNFEKVVFLSSAVLRALMKINTTAAEQKGQLRLCSIQPKILEIFKITKLDNIFDIRQNVETAVVSIIKLNILNNYKTH